jgi:hypothetical protein
LPRGYEDAIHVPCHLWPTVRRGGSPALAGRTSRHRDGPCTGRRDRLEHDAGPCPVATEVFLATATCTAWRDALALRAMCPVRERSGSPPVRLLGCEVADASRQLRRGPQRSRVGLHEMRFASQGGRGGSPQRTYALAAPVRPGRRWVRWPGSGLRVGEVKGPAERGRSRSRRALHDDADRHQSTGHPRLRGSGSSTRGAVSPLVGVGHACDQAGSQGGAGASGAVRDGWDRLESYRLVARTAKPLAPVVMHTAVVDGNIPDKLLEFDPPKQE